MFSVLPPFIFLIYPCLNGLASQKLCLKTTEKIRLTQLNYQGSITKICENIRGIKPEGELKMFNLRV